VVVIRREIFVIPDLNVIMRIFKGLEGVRFSIPNTNKNRASSLRGEREKSECD